MAFDAGSIEAKITLDKSAFTAGLEAAQAEADTFAAQDFHANLTLGSDVVQQIAEAQAAGEDFADQNFQAKASVDQNQMSLFDEPEQTQKVKVEPDTTDYQEEVDAEVEKSEAETPKQKVTLTPDTDKSKSEGASGIPAIVGAWAGLIAAAAPLVGGALVAGVAAGFIGIGAVLESGSEQVESSFDNLRSNVVESTRDMADQLQGPISASLDNLNNEFDTLAPTISDAFSYGGNDLGIFTDGIDELAQGVMPGLDDAMQTSGTVMRGVQTLLGNIGTSAGQMLTSLSQDSQGFEQSFVFLGSVVQSVLGLATGLITDFTYLFSTSGSSLASFVSQVASSIQGLIGGAVGPLGQVINVAANALTTLLSVLQPLDGVLGGVAVGALALWAAFKVSSTVESGINSLANGIVNFGTKVEGVSQGAADFAGKVGALAENVAGPLAIGLTVGATLIGLWSTYANKAVASAQDYANETQNVAQALQQSNGAVTASVIGSLQATDAFKNLTTSANQFGISQTQLTLAITNGGSSLTSLQDKLQGIVNAGTSTTSTLQSLGYTTGEVTQTTVDDAGKQAQAVLTSLNQQVAAWKSGKESATDALAAIQAASVQVHGPLAQLDADIQTIGDTTQTDTDQLNAMKDALKQLAGGSLNVQDAQQAINDSVRQATDAFKGATTAADGYGKTLLNNDGTINTTTQNGSALLTLLQNTQGQYLQLYQATEAQAKAQGDTDAAAQQAAKNAVQSQIPALQATMKAAGLTAAQQQQLISLYNLTPNTISTVVTAPGALSTISDIENLHGQVDSVPNSHTIIASALTESAITQLQSLGYTVTHLPNGEVQVVANTAPAQSELTSFIADNTGKKVTIDVVTQTQALTHTTYGAQAGGGTVSPGPGYASGGSTTTPSFPLLTGENGPEVMWANRNQFVQTAAQTKRGLDGSPPVQSPYGGVDPAMLAGMIGDAVAAAITGATLQVDGNGVAKLVNQANLKSARRGGPS
jgi:hypothetical protein